jgi:hypothetical protein
VAVAARLTMALRVTEALLDTLDLLLHMALARCSRWRRMLAEALQDRLGLLLLAALAAILTMAPRLTKARRTCWSCWCSWR